jgi:hypothetical protein
MSSNRQGHDGSISLIGSGSVSSFRVLAASLSNTGALRHHGAEESTLRMQQRGISI